MGLRETQTCFTSFQLHRNISFLINGDWTGSHEVEAPRPACAAAHLLALDSWRPGKVLVPHEAERGVKVIHPPAHVEERRPQYAADELDAQRLQLARTWGAVPSSLSRGMRKV
jgi:hypothetical protein